MAISLRFDSGNRETLGEGECPDLGWPVLRKHIPNVALAIVPLMLGLVGGLAVSSILPYFSHSEMGYDPSYQYLFNGMGIIRGFVPGHVDHPGTPLQILIGILSYADWAVRRVLGITTLNFEASVVNDPESYLLTVTVALLLLNVLANFYLGLKISRASRSIAVAILAQAGYFLFASQLPEFGHVSPEALTIFSAAIAMSLLSPYLFSCDLGRRTGTGNAVLVGCFLALGLVSKITFFPLLALLFLLPTLRWKLLSFVSLVFSSIVLFAPASPHFLTWLNFMFQIAAHSQYYGQGPAEFVDLAAVPARMLAFWNALPVLYIALVATILVGAAQLLGSRRPNRIFWQAGIFFAIIFAGLLAAVKHFGLRYAIPSLAIVPPVLAWSAFQLMHVVPRYFFRQAIPVAGLVCIAACSISGIKTCLLDLSKAKTERMEQLASLNGVIAEHAGAIVMGAYGSRNLGYAIQFGLGYVPLAYQKIVAAGRSDLISYHFSKFLVVVGEGVRDVKFAGDLVEGGKEVLFLLPPEIEAPAGLNFQLLYQVPGHERLLRVLKAGS